VTHITGVNDMLFAITKDNQLLRTNSEIVCEASAWFNLNKIEDGVGLAAVETMLYLLTADKKLCSMDMLHFRQS